MYVLESSIESTKVIQGNYTTYTAVTVVLSLLCCHCVRCAVTVCRRDLRVGVVCCYCLCESVRPMSNMLLSSDVSPPPTTSCLPSRPFRSGGGTRGP